VHVVRSPSKIEKRGLREGSGIWFSIVALVVSRKKAYNRPMHSAAVIFPHQLFADIALIEHASTVYLIEDYLFFRQYRFHAHKLVLHRASMRRYEAFLQSKGKKVVYIESDGLLSRGAWVKYLQKEQISTLHYYEVVDNWLEKDIQQAAVMLNITMVCHQTPAFLNSTQENNDFFGRKKKPFMKIFYEWQRKRLDILMNDDGTPLGGRFSFDEENRKKLPRNYIPPSQYECEQDVFVAEAVSYIAKHFPYAYGIGAQFNYATSHAEARNILMVFLGERITQFGVYEDAISQSQYFKSISQYGIAHSS
jgi:deoxyribodipyrimidine photolyase-related protein